MALDPIELHKEFLKCIIVQGEKIVCTVCDQPLLDPEEATDPEEAKITLELFNAVAMSHIHTREHLIKQRDVLEDS